MTRFAERGPGARKIRVNLTPNSLLSTRAEFVPETAQPVNVQGTLNLLHPALEEARELGRPIKLLFPSSIAVSGLPDAGTKRAAGKVAEDAWLAPITIYAAPSCTACTSAVTRRIRGEDSRARWVMAENGPMLSTLRGP